MYAPPAFVEDGAAALRALAASHPLALLIALGPGGAVADPVPMLHDPEPGPFGALRAHLARANPQVEALRASPQALVVFQGPQGYVTPSWYPSKRETGKVVPTWNYAVVQARGAARLVDDAGWLRRQIDDLTAMMEGPRRAPWAVDDAPAPFVTAQLRGIVGVEIVVASVEAKVKMSQNRPEADRRGVAEGFDAEPAPEAAALAALVRAKGGL
ncbi:MAG: FMN-binding negative transcriptional regulator [Rubrimonas sp.]|uniref:FMN-binding negative transcriptional regulator n=1 Tax=Rubrimonas sp. TaxID=2036015 RepID=UPI002FDD3C3B